MKLKVARLLKEMKQEDVAKELGVAMRTYGSWERGQTPVPYYRVNELEKILGVEEGQLELPELKRGK